MRRDRQHDMPLRRNNGSDALWLPRDREIQSTGYPCERGGHELAALVACMVGLVLSLFWNKL